MSSNTPAWFRIPTIEKCCCLQLKTGGVIVASLWSIPMMLAFGVTTWDMVGAAISRSNFKNDHSEVLNMTEEIELIENWHDSYLAQFAMVQAFTLTLWVICLLHIYGTFKEKRLYMVPFITFVGMCNTTLFSSELIRVLLLTTTWEGFLVSTLLGAFGLYSLLIIISYYMKLKQKPPSAREDDVIEAIEDALW